MRKMNRLTTVFRGMVMVLALGLSLLPSGAGALPLEGEAGLGAAVWARVEGWAAGLLSAWGLGRGAWPGALAWCARAGALLRAPQLALRLVHRGAHARERVRVARCDRRIALAGGRLVD